MDTLNIISSQSVVVYITVHLSKLLAACYYEYISQQQLVYSIRPHCVRQIPESYRAADLVNIEMQRVSSSTIVSYTHTTDVVVDDWFVLASLLDDKQAGLLYVCVCLCVCVFLEQASKATI